MSKPLNERTITIEVQDGASLTLYPGTPQWGEALGLLQGYLPDTDITDGDLNSLVMTSDQLARLGRNK